jgi:hypothetical protein
MRQRLDRLRGAARLDPGADPDFRGLLLALIVLLVALGIARTALVADLVLTASLAIVGVSRCSRAGAPCRDRISPSPRWR